MECYKELNKHLITEIQLMRSNIAFYQRELNATNKQLMKEHQKRIEQEQKFVAILTQSYRNMLNKLQPNADINNLIANCTSPKKNINEEINMSLTIINSNHMQENFRRSTEARKKFTNMVSISPIHRRHSKSSENETSDSETNMSPISVIEVEDEENENLVEDVRNDMVHEEQNLGEENEEEEDDEYNNNDVETEHNKYMEEELVTSLSALGILESIYEDDIDSENEKSFGDTSEQLITPTPKSQSESNNKKSLRDLSNYEGILRLSVPAKELSLPNLPNTSTPRLSAKNSSTFALSSSIIEKYDRSSVEEPRRRPKRSCTPTNLTERNLHSKLRNENSMGYKRKTRSSRSTRKNRSKD